MIDLMQFENQLYDQGVQYIAGVDEAGRGPLAGPVVVAAVILKQDARFTHINDSKQLSERQRDEALAEIKAQAVSISIAIGSVEEIEQINIYRATKEAMYTAIENLKVKPDFVLIDAMPLDLDIPNQSIIKGDSLSVSIAAASIVAKTTRDAYMKEMHRLFPQYGFLQHKGYATKAHIAALHTYGVTPIHRKTYEPIKSILANQVKGKQK